jgi:ABC-type multidrug transport system fused ATPase/permease subunit
LTLLSQFISFCLEGKTHKPIQLPKETMKKKNNSNSEKEIKKLGKYLPQSKNAIIGVSIFGVIVFVVLLGFDIFFDIRWWIYLLLLWVVPFGLIMDGINIAYINRKLRKRAKEES